MPRREGDFVGVVAEREEQARGRDAETQRPMARGPKPPNLSDARPAIRAHPSTPRVLFDKGDVESALGGLESGSIGIRLAVPYARLDRAVGGVADCGEGAARMVRHAEPAGIRRRPGVVARLPESAIEVIRMEAAGCYGRNCADDVAADAALLSRAVGAPVRVQLTREQEHMWEPKGAAQLIEIKGGLDGTGGVAESL